MTLGKIHAEPDRVVPVLVTALNDLNARMDAVRALGEFGQEAKCAVPALVEYYVAEAVYSYKSMAADALRKIDPEALAKAKATR